MDTTFPVCPICGGTEYFEEGGFYYCSDCQTQSQEIREEVHDYNVAEVTGTRRLTSVKQKNTKKTEDNDNEWTSWELHNFILSGMVDELIMLGASRSIKIVVLQLWATYLKKLEVAFTTKTKKMKLPKLGVGFNIRDAKLIYISETKKKKKKKRPKRKRETDVQSNPDSLDSSITLSSRGDLTKYRRALFRADYEKSYGSLDSTIGSKTLSKAGGGTEKPYLMIRRGNLSRAARAQLLVDSTLSTGSRLSTPKIITRKSLIAILYLALLLTEEKITLSDLIRWIDEGRISYYKCTHFLPEEQKLKGPDNVVFGPSNTRISYFGISKLAREMALFLNVNSLPTPNLISLARRYTEELQLPAEVMKYVENLIRMSPLPEDFDLSSKKVAITLPFYESQAIGFIIVVLKLLFGLDGKTEFMVSTVTQKINDILCKRSSNVSKLFVWTDWVKYIECRKTFLALHYSSMQDQLYQHSVINPNANIQYWNNTKEEDRGRSIFRVERRMNPLLMAAVETVMKKLDDNVIEDRLECEASLTPLDSCLKALLSSQPASFQSSHVGKILTQNFSASTFRHLIYPQPYVNLARSEGLTIFVLRRSAQVHWRYVDIVKTKKKYLYSKKQYKIISDQQSSTGLFEHLPALARKKLLKYLKKKKIRLKRLVEWKSKSPGCDRESDSESEKYISDTLFLPQHDYWFLEGAVKDIMLEEVNSELSKLPPTFLWLVKECARMVHTPLFYLYKEIVKIETSYLRMSIEDSD